MLRLIGGSRIQRNNSGTTWNGWATRTPTNSTIGSPHWTSTPRNTLQISIGASLTSPDHWLNYPDLRQIILGLIIFHSVETLRKFIPKLFKIIYMRRHVTSAHSLLPNHFSFPAESTSISSSSESSSISMGSSWVPGPGAIGGMTFSTVSTL